MQKLSDLHESIDLKLAFLIYFGLITLTSCSSFRGPGQLKDQATYKASSDYEQAPYAVEIDRRRLRSKHFSLHWPVHKLKMSRGFQPRQDPDHAGIDLTGRRGSPVMAAHDGFVVYSGRGYRGYGRMVLIEFSDEWASLYAHLDRVFVKEGDVVLKGETIGSMGRTGRTTGVHLHFELLREKQPIDPLPHLPKTQLTTHR